MHRGRRRAAGRHKKHMPAPWFTRVRALLAGALVLGVGATLTLAAWTDTEVARGAFTASTFKIVGSPDGTTFTDHLAANPATLVFSAPTTAMSPGTVVYSRYVIKTTADTNVTGTLSLSGAAVTGSGLGTYLRYGVRVISAASACDATSYGAGTSIVADGSALTAAASASQVLATAGTAPVAYCFALSLPAGTATAAQGLNATATWTFTATSDS